MFNLALKPWLLRSHSWDHTLPSLSPPLAISFICGFSVLQGWELLIGVICPSWVPNLVPSVFPWATTTPTCLSPTLTWVPRAPTLAVTPHLAPLSPLRALKFSSVPSNSPCVTLSVSAAPSLPASPLSLSVSLSLCHLSPRILPVTLRPSPCRLSLSWSPYDSKSPGKKE